MSKMSGFIITVVGFLTILNTVLAEADSDGPRYIEGCKKRTDDKTECSECYIGWVLMADPKTSKQICGQCSTGCKECDSPTECNECLSNFFMDISKLCIRCHDSCKSCNKPDYCQECQFGYYEAKESKNHQKAESKEFGFLNLHSASDGKQTDSGGEKSEKTNDNLYCLPCLEGCKECKDGNYCDKCTPSFIPSDDKTACVNLEMSHAKFFAMFLPIAIVAFLICCCCSFIWCMKSSWKKLTEKFRCFRAIDRVITKVFACLEERSHVSRGQQQYY